MKSEIRNEKLKKAKIKERQKSKNSEIRQLKEENGIQSRMNEEWMNLKRRKQEKKKERVKKRKISEIGKKKKTNYEGKKKKGLLKYFTRVDLDLARDTHQNQPTLSEVRAHYCQFWPQLEPIVLLDGCTRLNNWNNKQSRSFCFQESQHFSRLTNSWTEIWQSEASFKAAVTRISLRCPPYLRRGRLSQAITAKFWKPLPISWRPGSHLANDMSHLQENWTKENGWNDAYGLRSKFIQNGSGITFDLRFQIDQPISKY